MVRRNIGRDGVPYPGRSFSAQGTGRAEEGGGKDQVAEAFQPEPGALGQNGDAAPAEAEWRGCGYVIDNARVRFRQDVGMDFRPLRRAPGGMQVGWQKMVAGHSNGRSRQRGP